MCVAQPARVRRAEENFKTDCIT
ncbi:hypothetical protein A2U01_0077009, partial [Trifolium medium]|nr:hypothetical protein [Trifolium medium]